MTKKWITDNIRMVKRRQKMATYDTECRNLHKDFSNKGRQAKYEWLKERCSEIEK